MKNLRVKIYRRKGVILREPLGIDKMLLFKAVSMIIVLGARYRRALALPLRRWGIVFDVKKLLRKKLK